MRIAYVGLSTPLCYDYRNPASKSNSDLESSPPNPILESAYGLLLLHDEIWFLCRSLCPENMRELPYVKFLDELKMLPPLGDIKFDFSSVYKVIFDNKEIDKQHTEFSDTIDGQYDRAVKKVGIYWKSAWDSHTLGLRIGEITTRAKARSMDKLFFDMEVVRRLNNKHVELITNSYSQNWLQNPNNSFLKAKLSEIFSIENIPNYLTPQGPYNAIVEEIRNDSRLKEFRNWIAEEIFNANEKEKSNMKKTVEYILKTAQDIFSKRLSQEGFSHGVEKTIIGENVTPSIPNLSALVNLADGINAFFDMKKRKWQGLLV